MFFIFTKACLLASLLHLVPIFRLMPYSCWFPLHFIDIPQHAVFLRVPTTFYRYSVTCSIPAGSHYILAIFRHVQYSLGFPLCFSFSQRLACLLRCYTLCRYSASCRIPAGSHYILSIFRNMQYSCGFPLHFIDIP